MKTYEENKADRDLVVHSLKVLSEIKNPALLQLQRDLNVQQTQAQALAQRTDKYWTELSDDGVITPIEKKVVLREMESIATSYTALYTQAVAEQYDTAPFFQDYMAVYNALRNYIYNTLQLFDNMEEATEVDRAQFNEYFSNYYYSENYALVSMTVGVISDLGFKVLTSLEDEGEEGQVGIYQGVLYQYLEGEWKVLNRDLYYGYSAALPPGVEGRYFLCTADGVLSDVLYVNDEPLEVNGETLEIGNFYERGFIYVYENQHWVKKLPEEDYRYIVAMGDYYSLFQALPSIVKTEVENVAKKAVGSQYCGYSVVPPQNPEENDFFLYSGTTSGSLPEDREDWPDEPPPWIFAALYIYKGGRWKWLDESLAQNQKYYMEALQDILTITKVSSGYFSTVFCNAFFANQAALNALSTQAIYIKDDGIIKSNNWVSGTRGLMIDASGRIDANNDVTFRGNCTVGQNGVFKGTLQGATGSFTGTVVATDFKSPNWDPNARKGCRMDSGSQYAFTGEIVRTKELVNWRTDGYPITSNSMLIRSLAGDGRIITNLTELYNRLAQFNSLNCWVRCNGTGSFTSSLIGICYIKYATDESKLYWITPVGGSSSIALSDITSIKIIL